MVMGAWRGCRVFSQSGEELYSSSSSTGGGYSNAMDERGAALGQCLRLAGDVE